MAVDSAKSISSLTVVSTAIKNRYYDELFLHVAEKKLVHKQLGQRNKQIPQGQGGFGTGTVYWTRFSNLALVSAGQGEGVPTTAQSFTAANVTGSTAQYDAAVSISDIVAYTSFGDIMKAVMERLAYNAGLSIDTVIRNIVQTAGTTQAATGVAAAAYTSIPATGTLSITEVKKAVRSLDRNDSMQQTDGFYVGVAHTDSIYDLQSDTTTGGWIDANKYTEPNADKLMSGEVGKIHGTRWLKTSNGGQLAASGVTATATLYISSLFGSEAFGVTDLQALKTYVKDFSSGGTGDPTEKVSTAGWKTTFGAAPLNSAFFVNIYHTVSSTT